jgi:hypothetical protein
VHAHDIIREEAEEEDGGGGEGIDRDGGNAKHGEAPREDILFDELHLREQARTSEIRRDGSGLW